MNQREDSTVRFKINGTKYEVSANGKYTPESKLVDFIRDAAGLKGTKSMCREGGCGACVVTVRSTDHKTGISSPKAVNSCLAPIFSCHGWDISTVENLGNQRDGYHPLQERLVKFSGTQCGFCSPGMAMSMYSLLESKNGVSMEDVENSLDGNICRCTGYRPILDAFKSLAVDASEDILKRCADIEDCAGCPCPLRKEQSCKAANNEALSSSAIKLELPSGQQWIKATDLNSAFSALNSMKAKGNAYRIVAGNTGSGVFRTTPTKYYLNVSDVAELRKYSLDTSGVVLGSCTTLSNAIELLKEASLIDGYSYTKQISKHLQRVANVPVRNVATIGGNLMLKHAHREFPSDVFTLLEAVGAKIHVSADASNTHKMYSMLEFLNMDMEGKLIISLYLPQRKGDFRFRSFKITRRYQNAHAYVNGGILIKVDPQQDFKILEKPRIVFGGIAPDFVHASGTELFLMDKCLGDEKTLKGAMQALEIEVHPNIVAGEASPSYRKALCKSLLYKTILEIVGKKAKKAIQSGSKDIVREISKGKQTFDCDNGKTALYKAMPKLEATYQVSGEAEYINDMPVLPNELFGSFVLTTVANAELASVDASEALLIDGVHQFIDADDIPGKNNYMISGILPPTRGEQVFIRGKVEAAGQPIGLILAKTKEIADFAATKVKVTYKNKQKPIVNIVDALKKVEKDGTMDKHVLAKFSTPKIEKKIAHTIKGEQKVAGQYHYHMETQMCICIPKEDSLDIYSGTQWLDHTQWMIAEILNVPNNYINLQVKRIGGAFGSKLTRSTLIAAACAIAAHATKRPVRIALDMETNMKIIGKRTPYLNKYHVGFDENGKILDLNASIFCDAGFSPNEADSAFGALYFQNVYAADGWNVTAGYVTTNTPANTFFRAPGSLNTVALIETIMEHISFVLKKDPFEVRAVNYRKEGDISLITGQAIQSENLMPQLVQEIKTSADYEQRKLNVEKFNQENRWKKRGLGTAATAFTAHFLDANFPVFVTVYHADGSIAVTHGGVEMGQGINTKVAQTVAHVLEVPLEKIKIKTTTNFSSNNAFFSGASITSELCCDAALKACRILVERMKPIKETLEPNASWEELVAKCFAEKLSLSCYYMRGPQDNDVKEYNSWVITISEVEVDVLTGEYKVLRVDLLEDAGKSLSPLVDIGQIEGAFVMGQGLWTMENILHDEQTGELLTNRTWNYKAPESKDVPEDFRITLLHNAPNPFGVLRSKSVGEPPICSGAAVAFALQNAINSARKDSGNVEWGQINGPVTPEDVLRMSLTSSGDFTL